MPKKKTRKSVAKRCKITKSGKILFTRPGRSHLLGGKSSKRKRHLRRKGLVGGADYRRIMSMLRT